MLDKNDASELKEETIILNKSEFNTLKKLNGKKIRKIRYFYNYKNQIAEFDIFQDKLKGLVLIDFEFKTSKEKSQFQTPHFCLADVTQEEFIAGGMICGKTYQDIETELNQFNYKKIFL